MIGKRYVFKLKADNTFRARLMVQGWQHQLPGVGCCGTFFVPVSKVQGVWIVLASMAEKNWKVLQLDIQMAFYLSTLTSKKKFREKKNVTSL